MKLGTKILGALAAGALVVTVVQGCGSDKKDPTTSTGTTAINFSTEVAPILAASCTTSGCHDGSNNPAKASFTDGAAFKLTGSKARIELASTNASVMPPSGSKQLTAAEKTKLSDYLSGK